MRKTKVFAVAATATLILAVVGGWASSSTQVRATKAEARITAQIDSFQATANANRLPTPHYADFSMIFN
jgi:outer membrane lipoprotein-sorting protein